MCFVNGTSTPELGPMQINYIHFYSCTMAGYEFFSLLLLAMWVVFFISLLGNTATNYFSSTLASICGKLNLSYDIAGVTFLAFGNGAPDVFSSIASLTGRSNALIGIGSILGGSVFVTTIVVGSVAIICPCPVSGLSFTRDVVFYLLVATILAVITMTGKVTLLLAFGLFVVYIAYALAVVLSSYYQNSVDSQAREAASKARTIVPQVQTAYWYKPEVSSVSRTDAMKVGSLPNKLGVTRQSMSAPTSYIFLILDDSIHGTDDNENEDEEDTTVINLSGGLISAEFSALIIEDYFDIIRGKYGEANSHLVTSQPSNNNVPSLPISSFGHSLAKARSLRSRIESFNVGDDSVGDLDVEGGLTTSLLSSDESSSAFNDRNNSTKLGNRDAVVGDGMADPGFGGNHGSAIYWKQLLLRRRLQRSFLSSDWWGYPWYMKLLAIIELPVVLARDLTIPTIDEGMWFKPYAVVQPICALMFLLIVTGQFDDTVAGGFPVWALFLIIGIVTSIGVYYTTHHSYPPKSFLFSTLWVLFSFSMCIGWIYTLAGELVACLTSLGTILNIPPIFLGLTVLAWGNSIGDLFSNVAVARRGLGPMALAGCYGGPVFDILVGMGFALSIACSKTYPEPFEIQYDTSSLVSLVFLFASLLSTLIVVTLRGYVLERWFGYALIALYCVHTFVQAIFLILRT